MNTVEDFATTTMYIMWSCMSVLFLVFRDDCCGVLLDASEAPPSDDVSTHKANVSTYSREGIYLF